MKRIKDKITLITLSFAVLAASGCGYANQDHKYGTQSYRNDMKPGQMTPSPAPTVHTKNANLAGRISDVCSRISGVDTATAVIYNNKVIVGLDLDNNVKDPKAVERKVLESAKKLAPKHTIYVTSDKSLYTRIQRISTNTGTDSHRWKPLRRDFQNILNDMGRLIIPNR